MNFFAKFTDDWLAATEKGIAQVSLELASVASCENCTHYNPDDYHCSIHHQGVNKDSWTCAQFERSAYSEEVGGIYDGEPCSFPIDIGHYIESAPISVEGALAGDSDCCFVVACLLCDPITRGMINVMLAPNEPVREDTHVILKELTDKVDLATLKANDPRRWFHKAAYEHQHPTPGAKMAQRILDGTDSIKVKIKNIMNCKKYMNSIIEQSDYFKDLLSD